MRLLRRILITLAVTLAVVFVGFYWIAPVALSFYAAKNAAPVARIVPVELKDKSISQAPGAKLSYIGYEFEVPWNDLDETQTKVYPTDKPKKTMVDLHFRSGLRLGVIAAPPGVWAKQLTTEFSTSPQTLESIFGHGTMKSDYSFVKTLWEFSPDRMDHWVALHRPMNHRPTNKDEFLLIIKSIALPKAAETGIFDIQNQNYRGFQLGNPQVRQDGAIVDLYSDEGGVEMIFSQKNYKNSAGITQPEINRIVQSLRKAPQSELTTPRIAQR
jgi:hypothetical protein